MMSQKQKCLDRLISSGIVVVVRTSSPDTARRAVEAVLAGGITAVEVTFTVPDAAEVIRDLAGSLGDTVVLGAGTVTDTDLAARAIDAGATFLVAPNTDPDTIALANRCEVVAIPGALTPTEVVTAVKAGAPAVKIFPAMAVGPGYIAALRGPLPNVVYCPTGGIDLSNIKAYIEAGAQMLGVGGCLVDTRLIADGRYDEITERAKKFVEAVRIAREETQR
jgi:2-dehydro-3-deoxyphosphogluconate aldolase / (4S)-4-hydroxy-2-oxoglutarate aldolase